MFLLLYAFMYLMGIENPAGSIKPDWQALFNRRMILGIVLLGLAYPLIGFKLVKLQLPEGGLVAHERGLRDAAQLCGFRFKQESDGSLHFVAENPVRRALSVYEDNVVVTFEDDTNITVTGLRKDVARIELRIKDYVQDLKRQAEKV
ncbi:MAG: hypothetical protein LBK47_01945 [Prevotellaceae bacterium]|nr:hypothetical protein [Prevotellaceae bacterium]